MVRIILFVFKEILKLVKFKFFKSLVLYKAFFIMFFGVGLYF